MITQPRRVAGNSVLTPTNSSIFVTFTFATPAAMTTARRIAQEMGVELGSTVGYHVRYDKCAGSSTVIKVRSGDAGSGGGWYSDFFDAR